MVAPSWGSFQKPTQLDEAETQEFEQELPGKIQDEEKPEAKKPQWGNFLSPETYQGEPDPTADENGLEYIMRNATANASRLVEQGLGRFGNVEKFAKDALSNLPKTGGVISWALSELMGPEKWERFVKGPLGQQQMLPTSENLKKASQTISKGYTKPKTPGESKFQEYTEDVGAVLQGPRTPNLTGMTAAQRTRQLAYGKLLIPAAANVAKQITQGLGFGEDKANLVKAIVWLPLALANSVSGPQYASHLMNEGRKGVPNTLQANVPRFNQRLDAVERTLLSSDPRTELARSQIVNLRRDIANGQTNSGSLFTMYDGVNAAKRTRGMFQFNRNDQNFAREAIDRVRHAVRDEIMDVGANYPQALESWRNGVQAWSVIHTSNSITNWVENLARGPYAKLLSTPAAALFGVGSVGAVKAPMIAGPASAIVPATYKTGQTIYRMWNDPRLANYYWRAVGAAQEENLPAFLSNYAKLNQELKKSDAAKPKGKRKKD